MKNLLIGAISGNYQVSDIKKWVETSNFEGVHRTLLLYNSTQNPELIEFLHKNNIEIIPPGFGFSGQPKSTFEVNTGTTTMSNSYDLVHNLRFLHIYFYLKENNFEKIFTTDVKDVYFNSSPFDRVPSEGIITTGEVIKYKEDQWNANHLITNLGAIGLEYLDEEVLNVGVFGGGNADVKNLCRDIYLMSCGKHKVADQTSFNHLIRTTYKNKALLTSIEDNFAVHLQVVARGQVKFNLDNLKNYCIIHQYDRI